MIDEYGATLRPEASARTSEVLISSLRAAFSGRMISLRPESRRLTVTSFSWIGGAGESAIAAGAANCVPAHASATQTAMTGNLALGISILALGISITPLLDWNPREIGPFMRRRKAGPARCQHAPATIADTGPASSAVS